MSDDNKTPDDKFEPGERQKDETTEANKPSDARAKDDPKAGNILGGVQPD